MSEIKDSKQFSNGGVDGIESQGPIVIQSIENPLGSDSKDFAKNNGDNSSGSQDLDGIDPQVAYLVNDDRITRTHLKHVLITGAGFFTDSYDLFVVNLVLVLMQPVYGQTAGDKSMVACTAIWGAVVGQLVFGLLADVIGRKVIFMTTTALMIIGALGSALCTWQSDVMSIYQQMALWRFILGVGCGGEYPLAASITSESVSARRNGPMLASVFSMQAFGQLTGCILVIILLACGVSEDITWRVALAFGAVPGLAVFWFRKNMHETILFKDVKKRRTDGISYASTAKIAFKAFWWPFIGTAMSWCLLDFFFYGNSLFSGTITQAMGLSKSAFDTALRSLYITLFALPGYILAIFALNPLGRWNLQLSGFIIVSIFYFVLAGAYVPLQDAPAALIIIYGMSFFFKNFGPNVTTYVVPAEYYPSEVKGTLHGASAAAGKIGAGIAANAFPAALDAIGVQNLMFICASMAVAGGLVTLVFVPRYGVKDLKLQQAERMKMFYSEKNKIIKARASRGEWAEEGSPTQATATDNEATDVDNETATIPSTV